MFILIMKYANEWDDQKNIKYNHHIFHHYFDYALNIF
jgi:hypothetical protein